MAQIAVGPGGEVLAQGPYGVQAEALVCVDVRPRPPIARGTEFAAALQARGCCTRMGVILVLPGAAAAGAMRTETSG